MRSRPSRPRPRSGCGPAGNRPATERDRDADHDPRRSVPPGRDRDQHLWVWFNGHPGQCRIALKIDDGAEFEPAFTWQNPGVTGPAIVKIESAAIAGGDGKDHRITVSVWQAVGNRTSARATHSDYAKTPVVRPATQPEWCGVTSIRQGETLYAAPYVVSGRVKDLTRVDWRHSGAVQIMAKIPVRTQRADKSWGWKTRVITLGHADHDETTFVAEDLGLLMGWENGALREVWFGVASIHHGQFGPGDLGQRPGQHQRSSGSTLRPRTHPR